MFEMVMQWKSVGKTPVVPIAELRGRLGVEEGQYSAMCDFKKRVLDVAVGQVSDGEYTITYKQHKSGRTITGFEFFFTKNKKKDKSKTVEQKDSNTIDMFNGLTNKEREIVAQKMAYADNKGITDPLHRQNLINQALKQHRQAEQGEKERKEREKATKQAKARQEKERLELAKQQFKQILASNELINAYIVHNINPKYLSGLQKQYYEQGNFKGVVEMDKYKFEELHHLKYVNLEFLKNVEC